MKTELFTEKELAVINAITNSCFFDSERPLGPIWMVEPDECGFDNKKTLSGVISQLVQKGYVETGGTGRDAQIVLTQKYLDVINKNL